MQPRLRSLALLATLAAAACSGSGEEESAVALAGANPDLVAASCDSADARDVRRVIDSTMVQAEARLRRGESEALWDLYADDAIYMWDNQPMWRGKAEARREAAKVLRDVSFTDHKQTTDDMLVCGSLAVQAGRFEHTLRSRHGDEFKNSGKNLIVWMRQRDGRWKIVRNLGNDDRALQR